MKRLLKCRVSGWIFLAFTLLYFAGLSVVGFFATLNIIGYTYSGLVTVEETKSEAEVSALYSYKVNGEVYTYSKEIPAVTASLAPSAETVFYFRRFPWVTTESFNIVIYPIVTAVLGASFSAVFKHGQNKFPEKPSRLSEYKVPAVISLISLIPAAVFVAMLCNLNTSVEDDMETAAASVFALRGLLILVGALLLMWGIIAKVKENRKKLSEEKE